MKETTYLLITLIISPAILLSQVLGIWNNERVFDEFLICVGFSLLLGVPVFYYGSIMRAGWPIYSMLVCKGFGVIIFIAISLKATLGENWLSAVSVNAFSIAFAILVVFLHMDIWKIGADFVHRKVSQLSEGDKKNMLISRYPLKTFNDAFGLHAAYVFGVVYIFWV